MDRRSLIVGGLTGLVLPRGAHALQAVVADTHHGAAVATTWNTGDAGADLTFSGGNLSASNTTGNANCVRSTTSKTSGKLYFEITLVAGASSNNWAIGVADVTASLAAIPGSDTHSGGYYPGLNGWFYNGGFTGDFPISAVDGDVVGFAIDIGGGIIQVNKNAGSFTSHAESFPATCFAFLMMRTTGAAARATVNFGATAFTGSPPATYSAWG